MARGAVLTGRTLADLVQTALTLLVLAVVALLVGWRVGSDGDTNAGRVLAAFGLLLLLGYAFTWIGALIGLSVRTPEAATSGGLIWLFPVTFISNAFVDTSNMTPWLRHIAEWNPSDPDAVVAWAHRTRARRPRPASSAPTPRVRHRSRAYGQTAKGVRRACRTPF
ncbi:hypothetical protein SBADM41S_11374 [Streptomyces badius]